MVTQKRMLIAGGGYADIPLIIAAKKLGYYVITSGNRPDELGHKYSDEYQMADFSDKQAMLEISKKLNITAICPCCNDFSALSSAYVAEKMGLPGHDTIEVAKIIHHKDAYRQFADENGIPSPKAAWATHIDDAISKIKRLAFPLIIKPVDLTGGKGISTVYDNASAREALAKAFSISREKRIVVEEFIEGTRHGFSAFLRDGQIVFSFCDDEYYYMNPYLVSAASAPGSINHEITSQLCRTSEKIAALLELKTGLFHVQYIVHEGKPVIIEICRRAPGDLYVKLVELATGVAYADWIVRAAAGLDCGDVTHSQPKDFWTRHCVMASRTGTVRNISFDPEVVPNIVDKLMWWKPGDIVSDIMTAKLGIVFLRFYSQDEMVNITKQLNELIVVHIN